ncbi:MAG: carboxypeptidase-like regulatory domain-containing protein, partial [Clostridiales bacterium]|nr:carboxypeptidase-like regulatory domain-containing protein [Clostridiales bacterium]
MKRTKRIFAILLVIALAVPMVQIAYAEPVATPTDGGLIYIDDGTIRVTVDDNMNMAVYRWDGAALTPMTQPITPLGASGATAVTGAPWANALPWSTYTGNFNSGSARLLSAKTGYVTAGARGAATGNTSVTNDAQETLLADDFVKTGELSEVNVDTYFGKGNRLAVTGYSASAELEHTLIIETNPEVPGAAAVTSFYTYKGDDPSLAVAKFVNNNFKITDQKPALLTAPARDGTVYNRVEAGLWEMHGCPQRTNADYMNPVYDNLGTGAINNFDSGSETLARNNFSWANSGMGFPLNDFWGQNVGFLLGSMMPSHTYSLELPQRGSGITGNHETAYTWVGFPGKTLAKDVKTYVGTSLIGVHSGDYFDAASLYRQSMDRVDLAHNPYLPGTYDPNKLKLPTAEQLPDWAYAPSYETWGYGEAFLPENVMATIPLYKTLGIKSITYDAGWYQRDNTNGEGRYYPQASKWAAVAVKLAQYFAANPHPNMKAPGDPYDFSVLPCTNSTQAIKVVRALNEYIHVNGMYVKAWVMEPQARAGVPDNYYAKNASGAKYGTSRTFLCTGTTEVLDDYTDYFCDLMFGTGEGEYAFDGLKGDSFYGMPLCYDKNHSHGDNIYGAIEGFGQFMKNIYDKANYLRGATNSIGGPIVDNQKVAVIKNCMCGKPMDYYSWAGTNLPVPGDNIGSRQMRMFTKMYKGFYGANFAVDSDHVFLSTLRRIGENERSGPIDFVSFLGVASAMSTKFITDKYYTFVAGMDLGTDMHGNTHVNRMNFPGEPNYGFATGAAHSANSTYEVFKWGSFVKYYGLFNALGLSGRDYELTNLYKYGFDYPEGYAYKNAGGDDFYFSFFATDNGVDNSRTNNALIDPWGNQYGYASGYNTYAGNYISNNTYSGTVELRGLAPNTQYYVTNVETGKQSAETSGADGIIHLGGVEFTTGVILKVSPIRTASIYGKVFDGELGKAVAGADITLLDASGDPVVGLMPTAADLNGTYCFPFVPDGTYRIKVTTYKDQDGELYIDPARRPYRGADGPAYEAGVLAAPYDDYVTKRFTASGGETLMDIDLTDIYYSVSVRADAESDIDKNVELTLSTRGAKNLLTVEAEILVDGNMLAGLGVEALNGFRALTDIFWSYAGDG